MSVNTQLREEIGFMYNKKEISFVYKFTHNYKFGKSDLVYKVFQQIFSKTVKMLLKKTETKWNIFC